VTVDPTLRLEPFSVSLQAILAMLFAVDGHRREHDLEPRQLVRRLVIGRHDKRPKPQAG